MAFAKDHNFLYSRILTEKIRSYSIFDADGKTLIDANTSGELAPDQVVANLKEAFESLEGQVIVKLSKRGSEEASKGGDNRQFSVRIQLGGQAIQGIGSQNSNIGYNIEKLLELQREQHRSELEKIREEVKRDREIEDLKRQIKEAKESNPLIDKLAPMFIDGIFGQSSKPIGKNSPSTTTQPVPVQEVQSVQINGTGEDATQEEVERVEKAMEKWLAVDPDAIVVLEKVAELATTDSAKYNMAKSFL